MTYSPLRDTVLRFGASLDEEFEHLPFVVFLCGPTIKDTEKSSSILRVKLKEDLERDGFEVVLGEDDGLENVRLDYGMYTHENELRYIEEHCDAIVLIADSIGSFCELGLFAHYHMHQRKNLDFILLLNKDFEDEVSYVSEGPAKAITDYGMISYVDFENFDSAALIRRLRGRRSMFFSNKMPGGY